MDLVIGTPIHRKGAYVLDKFLDNQKQIQQKFPECKLVLSTDDLSCVDELKESIQRRDIKGAVISFKVEKPDYAQSRLWSIAAGREAIRQYILSQTQAKRLLFIDSDMTCDPNVVSIMEKEITNQDAVFSGYRFKNNRLGLTGAGCLLVTRKALEKIKFRCYEFKNGQVINEDNVLEMDLFKQGCRIKKGFFVSIDHYISQQEVKPISPQKVGIYRKIMTSSLIRFCLIGTSTVIHYNIASQGQKILWYFLSLRERLSGQNQ
jgi:hypothetical protein